MFLAAFFDLTRTSVWGPPRMFPPGAPRIPAMLHTPDLQMNRCQSCVDLKLTYNPNTEGGQWASYSDCYCSLIG